MEKINLWPHPGLPADIQHLQMHNTKKCMELAHRWIGSFTAFKHKTSSYIMPEIVHSLLVRPMACKKEIT